VEEPAGWTPPWQAARTAGTGDGPPNGPWRGPWRHGPWRHGSRRPLRRAREDRLIGGVAAGLAAKTCRDVTTVRIVLVVAAVLTGGFAAAAYVVAWLLVPQDGAQRAIAGKAIGDKRGLALAAAFGSLMVVVRILAAVFRTGWVGSVIFPLAIAGAGLILIWRNAPGDEQAQLRRLAEPLLGLGSGLSGLVLRLAVTGVLAGTGVAALQSAHESIALLEPLAGVALLMSAIVVLLGPWWLRIARDLAVERQARVRAEERADIAARVHDSVLQTLALIQRRADQPQQVTALARAQERELRSWLFDGRAPGSIDGEATSFAGGVRLIQQEVEAQHGVAVEAVTVGDCALDDNLAALLAAAREATVNAVKWSGAPVVSLFAEVEPDAVSVFVRDRGRGFDPAAVPADRKGLAESVHARMTRRGGTATVRSAPGEGTEVSLTMPRQPSHA
jgi:signal transduction histidine kinase